MLDFDVENFDDACERCGVSGTTFPCGHCERELCSQHITDFAPYWMTWYLCHECAHKAGLPIQGACSKCHEKGDMVLIEHKLVCKLCENGLLNPIKP
jgi:hypothetical protein